MDRRTLLAFLLAGVVLIGWSILFPTPRKPASEQAQDVASAPGLASIADDEQPSSVMSGTGDAVPAEAPLEGGVAGSPGAPTWEPQPVDSVEVETNLLRVRIHTHGAGLLLVELKDYPSGFEPGTVVDLVRAGQEALDVQLAWGQPEARRLSLANALYAAEREARVVDGVKLQLVTLTARRTDGLVVRRIYRFRDGVYEVDHQIDITGLSGDLESPEMVVGWRTGIPYTEGDRSSNEQHFASLIRVGDEVSSWAPGKFKNGPRVVEGAVRWAAASNKYFLAALVPAAGTAIAAGADGDASSHRNSVWLRMPAAATDAARADVKLYLGPKDLARVKAVDPALSDAVSLGYRWMRPLTLPTLSVLKFTYRLIPNYGLVIIVLSVLIRVILYPLNRSSMRSMKAMQRVQPEMEALRKKYADKPQEMNKQLMELYKKHKVNPVGGCLPMVLQMPVLFALYFSFMFAIDLRLAPFVAWIHDLSAPDTVAHISGFPIHVLPLIMTGVSLLQARSTPTDPRQKAMTTLMPIMLLVFFYGMPSGLVLYWTVTNLVTWVQQVIMNRADGMQPVPVVSADATTSPPGEPGPKEVRARPAGG